jgi:hypothetical protein
LAELVAAIDDACAGAHTPVELRELLVDARELLIDLDHARRHYKAATELAARGMVRARNDDGNGQQH